jgi:hypothetical protein
LAVISGLCLSAQGFERQPAHQPPQLLGHRFQPFHQGLGFSELTLSRVIFPVRRHVTGSRGKREQRRTDLVSGLAQPRRVPVLLPDFLPELPEAPGEPAAPVAPPGGRLDPEAFLRQRLGPDACDLYAKAHRELDRLLLPRVLVYTGGNRRRAALLLGIARKTLRGKLSGVGLYIARTVEADEDEPR